MPPALAPYPSPRNNSPSSSYLLVHLLGREWGENYATIPGEYARAVAYSHGADWIYFTTMAYTFLVLWGMMRWRVAPRLRDWAARNPCPRWLQFLLYAPALLLIFAVFLLPTDFWAQLHERKYGQSIEIWTSWFGGWTTAEVTTLISGTLAVAILYFTMRRSPNRWWLWLWVIAAPLKTGRISHSAFLKYVFVLCVS